MIEVPEIFRPKSDLVYPKHQRGLLIEEHVYCQARHLSHVLDPYQYLPIFWTAYYCNNGFKMTRELATFLCSLPKDQKYWTVCQYDDGIMADLPNVTVFSCSGKGNYDIPLLCDPHKVTRGPEKHIASFVGNINTHPIRKQMHRILHRIKGYWVSGNINGGTHFFCRIASESEFMLCPRGYCHTSFRLYEAMEMGCIPVYISDSFILPFSDEVNWTDAAVIVHESEIEKIPHILKAIHVRKKKSMRAYARELCERVFNMEAVTRRIINKVGELAFVERYGVKDDNGQLLRQDGEQSFPICVRTPACGSK
jgi:hypothetical protein